jgi:hypothetical protein
MFSLPSDYTPRLQLAKSGTSGSVPLKRIEAKLAVRRMSLMVR